MKAGHELVLALGVDASGKSTFLRGVQERLGYLAIEPTATDKAKRFKAVYAGQPIDMPLVRRRYALFREINFSLGLRINEELESNNVATSGLRLVTDISHGVMAKIVGQRELSIPRIVEEWQATDIIIPDTVVFVHAPIDVIHDRILRRQRRGQIGEQLAGFNSLHFLRHYQDALYTAYDWLHGVRKFETDTSMHQASELVDRYQAANLDATL